MKKFAKQPSLFTGTLFIVITAIASTTSIFAAPDSTDKYPNYTAARKALARGDCDATVRYLNTYLNKHPDLKEKQREFYLQLKIVIGQCRGTIRISGVNDESVEIDPLPVQPPTED